MKLALAGGARRQGARGPVTDMTAAGSPTRGLVQIAMLEFTRVLGDRPNQIDKLREDVQVSADDLLRFEPEKPITEAGLRMNINVGIHYPRHLARPATAVCRFIT